MKNPLCVFIAGSSNSGKTHILQNYRFYHNFTIINPDNHYEYFAEKLNLSLDTSNFTKEEYSVANKILARSTKYAEENFIKAVSEGKDIILDTTSASYNNTARKYKLLIENNYSTRFIFIYATPETILFRNTQRTRKLKPEIVVRTWIDTVANLEQYFLLFKSNFSFIKNDKNTFVSIDNVKSYFKPEKELYVNEITNEILRLSRNSKLNYFLRLKSRTPNYVFRELRKVFKLREKYTPTKNYQPTIYIPSYEEYSISTGVI